jgi:ABC-type lipoprotein release transport system permease subunit
LPLGPTRRDLITLVVGTGLKWTLVGIAAGLAGAYAATRLMVGLLFEVTATDPLTFVLISIAMIAVALGASFLPARRAAGTDPVTALRSP